MQAIPLALQEHGPRVSEPKPDTGSLEQRGETGRALPAPRGAPRGTGRRGKAPSPAALLLLLFPLPFLALFPPPWIS